MLEFIHNLRGVSILLILLAHSTRIIESDYWGWSVLFDYLENSTLFFVVISGYLFLVTTKNFNYLEFLKRKLSYVIIPSILVSAPATILYLVKLKTDHWWIDMDWFYNELNIIQQYIYLNIYGAQLGPLWFIPMVILFYLVSPILLILDRKNLLFITLLIALPFSLIIGRPDFNNSPFQSFVFFMPAYISGMILARHRIIYEKISGMSSLLLVMYSSLLILIYSQTQISSSVDLILKMILIVIVFSFFKKHIDYRVKFLDILANASYSLFLIHAYFISAFAIMFRHIDLNIPVFITFFIFFILVTAMSLMVFLITKMTFGKKSRLLIAG